MMKLKKSTILNWRHEFRDSRLEKEYSENEIKDSLWYVRPIILILGILFFSFIIPDCLLIKETKTLTTILLPSLVVIANRSQVDVILDNAIKAGSLTYHIIAFTADMIQIEHASRIMRDILPDRAGSHRTAIRTG